MDQGISPADWARFYAKANWRSFPIRAGGKQPSYKNWQADATTDGALIDRYWADADRNLGLICGEQFDVWDIEAQHIPAFQQWLQANPLPDAPLAATGRGGVHVFTAPTGLDASRYLYLEGVHIGELKSRGGFVLACPSETDGPYYWMNLTPRLAVPEPTPPMLALLERPPRLHKTLPTRLATPDDVVAVLAKLQGSVLHAGEGRRNSYLYWAMRRAIEEGVPEKHARHALHDAAIDAGLDEAETVRTIESAVMGEAVAA